MRHRVLLMPNLEQDRTEEGVQFLFRSPLDDQRAENEVETTVEIFRSWDLVELTLSRKRAKNPAIIITGRIFTIASHTNSVASITNAACRRAGACD